MAIIKPQTKKATQNTKNTHSQNANPIGHSYLNAIASGINLIKRSVPYVTGG